MPTSRIRVGRLPIPAYTHSNSQSSRGRRLRIVAHSLVQVPKLKLVVSSLGNLSNNPRRLSSNNRKTRDDHIRRDHCAVEDLDIVLDNGKLANGAGLADLYVVPDGGGLDDGALADKDVVSHAQRHVGEAALVHAAGGTQQGAPGEEAVAADGDGGVAGRGAGRRGRGGRGGCSGEVAADHDFGLDDGLAAEHDVLSSDEDSPAGHLVAGVLGVRVSVWASEGVEGCSPSQCTRPWAHGATWWAGEDAGAETETEERGVGRVGVAGPVEEPRRCASGAGHNVGSQLV